MARLIINAPIERVSEYLEVVTHDIENGCYSGYWDTDSNWEIFTDDGESLDDMR